MPTAAAAAAASAGAHIQQEIREVDLLARSHGEEEVEDDGGSGSGVLLTSSSSVLVVVVGAERAQQPHGAGRTLCHVRLPESNAQARAPDSAADFTLAVISGRS